jgi:hypothetical protein
MTPALLVGLIGLVLVVVWLAANRRHVQRREQRSAEWDDDSGRVDLWTSSARCPRCDQRGGLLERSGDLLEYVCLACGDRHARQERG